jgi:MFS family permease
MIRHDPFRPEAELDFFRSEAERHPLQPAAEPNGVRSPESEDSLASSDRERQRNYRLHVLEGATLNGALGAISSNTVGTSLVEHLGGAPWMVALMPMAATIGFAIGPILTAHHLDHQANFLPALRRTLPLSRLPLLLTAMVLWGFGAGPLSLWTVLLSSLAYGLISGLSVGAWQQLILRTVPASERSSLFAWRYLVANVLALGVSGLVGPVLAHWPGTRGYALLYVMAFAGAILSYRLLTSIREPCGSRVPVLPAWSFWQNLREVPRLFASDRRLCLYLWTAMLINSQFLLMAFLALHARDSLGKSEAYAGTLTSAQMLGAVFGTFVAARVGNRKGSRTLLIAARLLLLTTALGALWADSDWAFRVLFALYGAAFWVNLVGHNTLTLELLPPARRSTVLATFGLVQVPCMLAAAQIGAWLWHAHVSFAWIAGCSAFGLFASLFTMLANDTSVSKAVT